MKRRSFMKLMVVGFIAAASPLPTALATQPPVPLREIPEEVELDLYDYLVRKFGEAIARAEDRAIFEGRLT